MKLKIKVVFIRPSCGVINVSSTIRYKIKVAMITKKGHQLQQLHPAEKHHEMSGYMHRSSTFITHIDMDLY